MYKSSTRRISQASRSVPIAAISVMVMGIPSLSYATDSNSLNDTLVQTSQPGYESSLNPFTAPSSNQNRWFVNVDMAAILVNASAEIFSPGPNISNSRIPGASVRANNSYTLTFDLGYFVTRNLAVNIFAGIPPWATVRGKGTVESFGPLLNTMYAPAILSLQYYYPGFGSFVPYVGVGINRTFFRNVQHKALWGDKVADAWGTAFQVGAQYKLNNHWAVNGDLRYVLLQTHISAGLAAAPEAPRVFAKATINPAIIEAGVDYSF